MYFFVINLATSLQSVPLFQILHPLGATFFVLTWTLLLGICRHSTLHLLFMYPHPVLIETGTLPCDGVEDFPACMGWEDTILPYSRALNSKGLSFLCKQVSFKLCGMLLCHLTFSKHLRVHCVLKPCLGL